MRTPELDPALNWTCGYSPTGVPDCLAEATWHGFLLDELGAHIESMMAACDAHQPRMQANADYVHPMIHPCAVPGSRFRWPENQCYTEWDDRELVGVEVSEIEMAGRCQP